MTSTSHPTQAFHLAGAAGETIRGHLHLPAGPGPHLALVACHGFKGFAGWGFFPWLAERLTDSGIAVVRFDFSHCGVGEKGEEFDRLDLFERNRFSYELFDLEAVAAAIEDTNGFFAGKLDPARLSLLGHSRGGGVAILAAAERPARWKKLVTLNAISHVDRLSPEQVEILRSEGRLLIPNARTGQDMPVGRGILEDVEDNPSRYDIRAAASRVLAPWLVVHGDADETVPIAEGRLLHEVGPHTEALWIPGGGHTLGATHPFREPTSDLEGFAARTAEFLREGSP